VRHAPVGSKYADLGHCIVSLATDGATVPYQTLHAGMNTEQYNA